MKVVYNACRGGFGLSESACQLLASRLGFDLAGWGYNGTSDFFNNEVVGSFLSKLKLERHDQNLVYVVETLGEGSSGEYAELAIEEIPDSAEYEILEYAGVEEVVPPRKVWVDFTKVLDTKTKTVPQTDLDKLEAARIELCEIMEKNDIDYPYYAHISNIMWKIVNCKYPELNEV